MEAIRSRVALLKFGSDRGDVGPLGYVGILLLVASIIVVLFGSGIGDRIKGGMNCAVDKVLTAGGGGDVGDQPKGCAGAKKTQ
jgi:hypothetical protein